ncbi:hypothetical protein EDB89DRAFT_642146 [Lactarius sanguifluus]|nr:hypothetical protein EDB89DRAFT_642146 [Lactarius sanguifluus]
MAYRRYVLLEYLVLLPCHGVAQSDMSFGMTKEEVDTFKLDCVTDFVRRIWLPFVEHIALVRSNQRRYRKRGVLS